MPKDPLEKLIDRPKRRRWFKPRQPAWIVLEPSRIGMAGGAISATGALVLYFVRQQMGAYIPPQQVLIGAAATFVIGYGAVGIFTWYLLWVAERELPIPEEEFRHFGIRRSENAAPPAEGMAPPAPTESNEES